MFFNFLKSFAIFFFLEFSRPDQVGTEFGINFFFLFLCLSHHGLDRNNAGLMFFNFLNFFAIFFCNFLAKVGQYWNSGLNFFSLFLGLSHPGLDKNNAGIMFFSFLNFFTIFLKKISCLDRVGMEFGTKIFFLSFSVYLIPVWMEIIPE